VYDDDDDEFDGNEDNGNISDFRPFSPSSLSPGTKPSFVYDKAVTVQPASSPRKLKRILSYPSILLIHAKYSTTLGQLPGIFSSMMTSAALTPEIRFCLLNTWYVHWHRFGGICREILTKSTAGFTSSFFCSTQLTLLSRINALKKLQVQKFTTVRAENRGLLLTIQNLLDCSLSVMTWWVRWKKTELDEASPLEH